MQISPYSLVFGLSDGNYINPYIITRNFMTVAWAIGLPELSFHGLRHSHATLMLKEGVPIKVVSERLGHASIHITFDTYSHGLSGMQEAAAQSFEDSLDRQSHPVISNSV